MTESTKYAHVFVTSRHDGNESSSVRQESLKIFVGDGNTVLEKKRLLWGRVQEHMAIWYDVGFSTIYTN